MAPRFCPRRRSQAPNSSSGAAISSRSPDATIAHGGLSPSGGNVPEEQWLTGDKIGFRGPWGTTYPINLRLHVQAFSEERWLEYARALRSRPPMPWFALRDMSDEDLRAIYYYIRHVGPAGEAMPAYLPPGEVSDGPVIQFPE